MGHEKHDVVQRSTESPLRCLTYGFGDRTYRPEAGYTGKSGSVSIGQILTNKLDRHVYRIAVICWKKFRISNHCPGFLIGERQGQYLGCAFISSS